MKHSLTGIGTGGAIGALGAGARVRVRVVGEDFRISGNTRVGLFVRWFSFGEL